MKALTVLGIGLLVFGAFLIISSLISSGTPSRPPQSTSFAGCVVIFFIPICFGGRSFNPIFLELLGALTIIIFIALFTLILYVSKKAVEGLSSQ